MKEHENLLRDFIREVWSEGRLEHIDRYIGDRYTIHHDPGDPWEGQTLDRDGFCNRVSTSRAPFPDQRFEIQDLIPAEDRIAITWLWAGTHLGDYPGFPASGKSLTMSGATVYHFTNGRLSGHWQISDRAGIYFQLTA